jgi:hypothetical protein
MFAFRIGFSGEKKPANDYDLIRNGTSVVAIDSSPRPGENKYKYQVLVLVLGRCVCDR